MPASRRKETMAKKPDAPKVVAIDDDGKRTRVRAVRLEIDYDDGRRLLLDLSPGAWGDLEIEADSVRDSDLPVISLQPGACNLLSVRVEVHPEAMSTELEEAVGAIAGAGEGGIAAPRRAAPPHLTLSVQRALEGEDKANAPRKNQIRRWARAALHEDAEVTVRLVGEEEGRMLNRQYRGKDYATNVLSFAYDEGEAMPAGGADTARLSGDLVLCVPVVIREALEQGKTPDAHFAHLVVHGMLHLQGYEHEAEADAERMEGLETEILRGLGYADPYA